MNNAAKTTTRNLKKQSNLRKNGSNGNGFDPNKYMLKLPKNIIQRLSKSIQLSRKNPMRLKYVKMKSLN